MLPIGPAWRSMEEQQFDPMSIRLTPSVNGTALVTGASSGVGAVANPLALNGLALPSAQEAIP